MNTITPDILQVICETLDLNSVLRILRLNRGFYIAIFSRPIISDNISRLLTRDIIVEKLVCKEDFIDNGTICDTRYSRLIENLIVTKRLRFGKFRELIISILDNVPRNPEVVIIMTSEEYENFKISKPESITIIQKPQLPIAPTRLQPHVLYLDNEIMRLDIVSIHQKINSATCIGTIRVNISIVDDLCESYCYESGKLSIFPSDIVTLESDSLLRNLGYVDSQILIELQIYRLLTDSQI